MKTIGWRVRSEDYGKKIAHFYVSNPAAEIPDFEARNTLCGRGVYMLDVLLPEHHDARRCRSCSTLVARMYRQESEPEMMTRVVLESPFAAPTPEGVQANIKYARRCVRDCLNRNEAPIASHLLFTQEGILDDTKPEERALGMKAGFAWNVKAEKVVVYTDRGISKGMHAGVALAKKYGIPVEYRAIDNQGKLPHPDVVVRMLKEKYNLDISEDDVVACVNGKDDRLAELVSIYTSIADGKSEPLPALPAWLLNKNATESTSI